MPVPPRLGVLAASRPPGGPPPPPPHCAEERHLRRHVLLPTGLVGAEDVGDQLRRRRRVGIFQLLYADAVFQRIALVQVRDDVHHAMNVRRGVGDDDAVACRVAGEVGIHAHQRLQVLLQFDGVHALQRHDLCDQRIAFFNVLWILAKVNGNVPLLGIAAGDDFQDPIHPDRGVAVLVQHRVQQRHRLLGRHRLFAGDGDAPGIGPGFTTTNPAVSDR